MFTDFSCALYLLSDRAVDLFPNAAKRQFTQCTSRQGDCENLLTIRLIGRYARLECTVPSSFMIWICMEPLHPPANNVLTGLPSDTSTPMAQTLSARCSSAGHPEKGRRPGPALGIGLALAALRRSQRIPLMYAPRTRKSVCPGKQRLSGTKKLSHTKCQAYLHTTSRNDRRRWGVTSFEPITLLALRYCWCPECHFAARDHLRPRFFVWPVFCMTIAFVWIVPAFAPSNLLCK